MPLADEERERYIQDVRIQVSARQMANWIADTRRITEMVARGEYDVVPVFWIRIYGVLADIGDCIAKQVESLEKDPQMFARLRLFIGQVRLVEASLSRVRKVFTADELIYLQYLRHVHSHPVQDSYRIRIRKAKFKDRVTHKLLGEQLTVEETNSTISRVLRRYRVQEDLIAQDFAVRVLPSLENFRVTSIAWCGEASNAHLPVAGPMKPLKRGSPQ